MRRDGQVLEVGQVPPALAPFHPAKFFLRFRMCRNVIWVDRLVVQCLGKRKQHLCQFALGLKMIRTRTVVLLLVASQFDLQTQNFDVQIVGKTLLFLCPSRLLFGSPLLLFGPLLLLLGSLLLLLGSLLLLFSSLLLKIALIEQRSHHGLQCFLVVG